MKEMQQEIVNKEYYMRAGYNVDLKYYILSQLVFSNITYDKYYIISKEEYELFVNDFKKFYLEFLENKFKCIGANNLCEYDCYSEPQNLETGIEEQHNPFKHHFWYKNILWARILWNGKYYLIPPMQKIVKGDNNIIYPLREKYGVKPIYKDEKIIFYAIPYEDMQENDIGE